MAILLGSIFRNSSPSANVTVSESSNTSSVGDLGYGSYTSAKPSIAQAYPSGKSPLSTIKDDFLMDIGAIPKDASYYSRLAERNQASQNAMNALIATNSNKDHASPASIPREPTAAELEAQRKAAALARRKEEGQTARKEYERKKGTLVLAQRKKYTAMLNV